MGSGVGGTATFIDRPGGRYALHSREFTKREEDMTARVSRWRFLVTAPALAFGGAMPGGAAELDPAALVYKWPEQLKWRDPTGAAGVNQAVLHGDPTKTGLYVVLNRFKPGNFSKPHFHPNDRFITVIKGTWWVATGNKVDKDDMVPMPTGSFVTQFWQAGALGWGQGRGGVGAHRRRRAGNADAGRAGEVTQARAFPTQHIDLRPPVAMRPLHLSPPVI
jgi:hypothetical protein